MEASEIAKRICGGWAFCALSFVLGTFVLGCLFFVLCSLGFAQKGDFGRSSLRPSVYLCGLCVEMTVNAEKARYTEGRRESESDVRLFVQSLFTRFEDGTTLANKIQSTKYKAQSPHTQALTRPAAPRGGRLSSPAGLEGNKPGAPQKSTPQTQEQK